MKSILLRLLGVFAIGLMVSCGEEESITGTNVSDMLWLEHKGAQMPILVEGNVESKTFILILHGGPGGTAMVYNEFNLDMSEPLEERFAVAYWDQRLSGNSKGNFDKSDQTVELMIEDTDKAIDLLRYRYGDDISIFLLGHSWGGYLGNAYLAQSESNQAKISGWIDVAGAHNIEKIMRDGMSLMKEVATEQVYNKSEVSEEWEEIISFVDEIGPDAIINDDVSLKVNTKAISAIRIARKDDLIIKDTPRDGESSSLFFDDNHYLNNIISSIQMSKTDIWETILYRSLTGELNKIKTPSLLLWGKYDFVVPSSVGEEAFENLGTADVDKSFYIFEKSGHSPTHEEPGKFVELVIEFVDSYN